MDNTPRTDLVVPAVGSTQVVTAYSHLITTQYLHGHKSSEAICVGPLSNWVPLYFPEVAHLLSYLKLVRPYVFDTVEKDDSAQSAASHKRYSKTYPTV